MRTIGFSTGALAFGDFERGLSLQRKHVGATAVELSALRETELDQLIDALPRLNLDGFKFVSIHVPSTRESISDAELVSRLTPIGLPLIIHPDVIQDPKPWRELKDRVYIENMDTRKRGYQSAVEMLRIFEELPDARFCFDIGHAHQVDPTMSVAIELLTYLRDRLAEVHISEVNWQCHHVPISTATELAFHLIARWIPEDVPVIIESVVDEPMIQMELHRAMRSLTWQSPIFSKALEGNTLSA